MDKLVVLVREISQVHNALILLNNVNIDPRAFSATQIGNSVAVVQINYGGFGRVSFFNAGDCLYQ